jgi:hypothetical protein
MTETEKVSKSERRKATEKWRASMVPDSITVGPTCQCSERPYTHDAHTSESAIFEYHRSLKDANKHASVPDVRRRKHHPATAARKLERNKNTSMRRPARVLPEL